MERMIHEAVMKERMERMVHEAAMKGSVTTLLDLLQEDALILDRFVVGCFTETPLHIAAILGHVEFTKEILNRKPELAQELDAQKSSPLHLATAKGYLEVVKLLLSAKPEMCSAQDREGRNPLHIAVMKGRDEVLKELIRARPQAAQTRVDRGETILHLCVKHVQLEALKLLVETMGDRDFVNSKDNDGFTILHLAVADKQSEIINYLITSTSVEVNAVNLNGFTALDILAHSRRELKDIDIGQSLERAGAIRANDISLFTGSQSKGKGKSRKKQPKTDSDWLEKKRNALMVLAATLIAAMAFQAGINQSDVYPWMDMLFLVFNATGFMSSLSIILLLISGLPFKNRIFMVIMLVAVLYLLFSYTLEFGTPMSSCNGRGKFGVVFRAGPFVFRAGHAVWEAQSELLNWDPTRY